MKERNMIFGIMTLAGSTILAAYGAPESAPVGPSSTETERNFAILAASESGGVARPYFTAIGAGVSASGVTTVATENGGTLSNVEKGVPADIALESAEFFNRTVISEKINQRLNLE